MKIGILITSIGNFGQNGFYNTQEIGLARELDHLFEKVIIYKSVSNKRRKETSEITGCKNTSLKLIPCKHLGINGIFDLTILDRSLDVIIYFSDIQLIVPQVYKWCIKNKIKLFPYIGVIKSHNENKVKKIIMDIAFMRNINIYKKCICLVKSPDVKKNLNERGVKNCLLAPIGLDKYMLKNKFENIPSFDLKKKWGYREEDKILLFVGRLVLEKRPIELLELFEKLIQKDKRYRLLIIGTGNLEEKVKETIVNKGMHSAVKIIDKISNDTMWELYRISDVFINLNKQEIFGMAILEAMYYECKVIAYHAPGPDFIIEHGISGYLAADEQDLIKFIEKKNLVMGKNAHSRITDGFLWRTTVNKIIEKF